MQAGLDPLTQHKELREMVATIAHGLNQPLTATVNYLNEALLIAGPGYDEASCAEVERLVRRACEQVLRAADMIRRLREIGEQNGDVRSVERAGQLVESAVARMAGEAHSAGIRIRQSSTAQDAEVEVDAIQIQQILVNLIRNAIEAIRDGARRDVEPSITVSNRLVGQMVEFGVCDNGPGIAPELADSLFEPFVTGKALGAGMGLTIARQLVELHGGAIQAAPSAGGGARFRFRLPRYTSAPKSDCTG